MRNHRRRAPHLVVAALLASTTVVFANPAAPVAAAAPPTIVTIEWHDGNADQIDVLPILEFYGVHATFLVNTGPILAGDTANLSVEDLNSLYRGGERDRRTHAGSRERSAALHGRREERDLHGSEQPPPHGISEQLPTHVACLPVRLVR